MVLIALYKATSPRADFIDKLISFGTRSLYTHSELIIEKDGIFNQVSVSPRDSSLREKPHIFDYDSWDYFEINSNKLDETKLKEFCNSKIGTKYDWIALLGFIVRLKINLTDRLICSEFVTEAVLQSGVQLFNCSKSFMVSPAMLGDNPLLIKLESRGVVNG